MSADLGGDDASFGEAVKVRFSESCQARLTSSFASNILAFYNALHAVIADAVEGKSTAI